MNRFENITKPLMWSTTLLLAALVAGCGGSGDGVPGPGPGPAPGPAAVNLLTAGNFVILANSAITGAASAVVVTGDMGISPGVSTAITGFTMTRDTTCDFATATQVASPGKIYAPDYVGGTGAGCSGTGNGLTPAKMTAAQNDMITAYNDAFNRTPGVGATNLDLGAGTLTTRTLTPGTYTWKTPGTAGGNVSITGDITLTGTATDVWIFQIAGTLTQATATNIILGGTAKAKNIFWQVAGGATLNGTAHMEGVILSKTTITLPTTSSANSRLLAQTAVTLGGTVTQPAP
jgi:hypothetical protein